MSRLMRGNDAAVFGALMEAVPFYGYPITPASEITESAAHCTISGRVFYKRK